MSETFIPKPLSPFIFDETFAVDRSKILLVVSFQAPEEICVWMPQYVTENMSDTLPDDLVAAVKDFLLNVPRKRPPV